MTASAPTLIEDASLRAPFICTVCQRSGIPVVVVPALHASLEGNHQVCADCVGSFAELHGLKVVERRAHNNTQADAFARLNDRNDELSKLTGQLARALKSMAQAGFKGQAAMNVYCSICYMGLKSTTALAAHCRESHQDHDGGVTPLSIEGVADQLLVEVGS